MLFEPDEEAQRWQDKSLCSKKENKRMIDWFFSDDTEEKYAAKNLCFKKRLRQVCSGD